MKLRYLVIALTFLTAISSDSWGQSQGKTPPREEAKSAQQPTQNNQRGTEQAPFIIKITPTPKTSEETEGNGAKTDNKSPSDLWLVVFTGLLVLVGAMQLAVFGWQGWQLKRTVSATKKAVDLGNKEFIATHRPKIRIKHVWLLNEFGSSEPIRIEVDCVNVGTSDARFIDYGCDFLLVRKGASFPAKHDYAHRRQINTVLKSGITGPFPDLVLPVTQEAELAVRNALADFYCVGYLHYMDGANNVRTTAFCRKLIVNEWRSGHFVLFENPDYEYQD
jgi:hypothetical protein